MNIGKILRACLLASSLWLIAGACMATQIAVTISNSTLTQTTLSFGSRITSLDSVPSKTLRYELWAFPTAYAGGPLNGFRALQAESSGGFPLGAGFVRNEGVTSQYSQPSAGTYFFSLFVTEQDGAATNDGFVPRFSVNFSNPLTFGPPPVALISPQIGLWWNPRESGSGYNIDFKRRVLVVTVFSYAANGEPAWYLASGALSATNLFVGTLDKYRNGQCIACAYTGPPTLMGNDGPITIQFHDATSATMTLPGGRTTSIVPQPF